MINWKKDFFVTPAKVIAVFVVLAAVLTISLSFGKAILLAVWNLLSHPELINVPDLNTFAIAVFGGIGFSFYLTAFGAIVEESNALAGSLRSNSEKPSISPKVYLFGLWSICFITLAVSMAPLKFGVQASGSFVVGALVGTTSIIATSLVLEFNSRIKRIMETKESFYSR